MPASDILVPVYSSKESVGSSISLVILSDTETETTIALADVPTVIPEVALEAKAAIVTSPTNVLDLTIHSNTEANVASHSSSSSSSTSTPPASLQIVCAPPGLPHLPVVLVLPGQEIPWVDPTVPTLTEVSIEDSIEVGYDASIEDGTEIGYEASIEVTLEVTVEVAAEPDTTPILPEETVAKRLDGHKEVIQEMYDHLLETPLQRMEEVEEETRTLTSRPETAKTGKTTLRDRVRSLELHEMSLHDTLRVERGIYARVRRHLRYVLEELRQRQSMIIMPATRSGITHEAIEEVIAQSVNEGGNENDNDNNNNGNGNHGDNMGGAMQAARECTSKEFLNCQPLNFKGTEGAVVRTDVAYAMTWKEFIRVITEVYCPRNDAQKMDYET
nr:hypothetical protein [Tanacetum cinerariifolium]